MAFLLLPWLCKICLSVSHAPNTTLKCTNNDHSQTVVTTNTAMLLSQPTQRLSHMWSCKWRTFYIMLSIHLFNSSWVTSYCGLPLVICVPVPAAMLQTDLTGWFVSAFCHQFQHQFPYSVQEHDSNIFPHLDLNLLCVSAYIKVQSKSSNKVTSSNLGARRSCIEQNTSATCLPTEPFWLWLMTAFWRYCGIPVCVFSDTFVTVKWSLKNHVSITDRNAGNCPHILL